MTSQTLFERLSIQTLFENLLKQTAKFIFLYFRKRSRYAIELRVLHGARASTSATSESQLFRAIKQLLIVGAMIISVDTSLWELYSLLS